MTTTTTPPTPPGVTNPQPTNPGNYNPIPRHKPSIGEWVSYICYVVVFCAVLGFFSPLMGCVTDYLKADDYQAIKSLTHYYSKTLDHFPMGLTVGLLGSPVWWALKKLKEKFF